MKTHIEEKTKRDYIEARRVAEDPDSVEFPKIKITGENYEVTGSKKIISAVIGWLRLSCLAFLFLGDTIVSTLGDNGPDILKDANKYVKENQVYFGAMAFFGLAMIQNSMMQSGAFEIYINDNLEFSKL